MSACFHSYLCGRKAAEWLINMKFECYNLVESITDEATKRLCEKREIPAKKEFLKMLCEDIDKLIEFVEAETFAADVDEDTTDIFLSISCPEIIVESIDHPLHQILVNVKSFAVAPSQDVEDGVELRFCVPGIWQAK